MSDRQAVTLEAAGEATGAIAPGETKCAHLTLTANELDRFSFSVKSPHRQNAIGQKQKK